MISKFNGANNFDNFAERMLCFPEDLSFVDELLCRFDDSVFANF